MAINRRDFIGNSVYAALASPFITSRGLAALQGSRSRVHAGQDGSIHIGAGARSAIFRPRFSVLQSDEDPHLHVVLDPETNFRVPAWGSAGSRESMTDIFQASHVISIEAATAQVADGAVRWIFPPDQRFQLEAEIRLPADMPDPIIYVKFSALQPGWYSIGYTGAPEIEQEAVLWLWQPLVWQERRFPSRSFLSMEHMCSVPATFVKSAEGTVGIAIDPSEVPFRLPTFANSRFGVALRNAAGKAQPMVFAPVFGKPESHIEAGGTASLRFRIFLRDEEWFETFRHTAQDIFGFRDSRSNGPVSLNTTLDNMTDLVMNDDYCGWVPELKGFDYTTDVAGTVKVVSALHPLSLAIVRDSAETYFRRALPMIEYMMSRQKYLYSEAASITGQNASHLMKGPCAEVSELAALYSMSLDRTSVFSYYAKTLSRQPRRLNLEMVSEPDSFQNLLALYRMTEDAAYLDRARKAAEKYIENRIDNAQQDFQDVHVAAGGQFWTDFAPKWIDLLELYEATKDKRFLDAAEAGAREYTQYVWLQPPIPAGEVVANKGSEATMKPWNATHIPDRKPMRVAEQVVPAWRIAQAGLTPEASTTYADNPAVFLANFAPYMLRMSQYTGDKLFRSIARSAIIGRYENYPGYTICGEYTTLYQRRDYPLRPWKTLTYNNIYYNHILPQIIVLLDYLVSDAFVRSEGKIRFPSRYAQGYAYLQSKVYGDRKGEIYGETNVALYLPRGLVTIDHPEVNYIAAYGKDKLYLILMNQCDVAVRASLRLDPNVVPLDVERGYAAAVWHDNTASEPAKMIGGAVVASVSPQGITVLAIDGVSVFTEFQNLYFDPSAKPLSERSYRFTSSPFGKVNAMLISMGRSLETIYVWLEATEHGISEARLISKDANQASPLIDRHYPYEFSIPFTQGSTGFEFYIEAVRTDGSIARSDSILLQP